MKITFIIPYARLNGGHRVIATYARHLRDRGHEITIISQPYVRHMRRRERLKNALGLYRPPAPPAPMPLFDFLGDHHRVLDAPRAPTAEDVPDADILIATWWETAFWVADLPAAKGRKFHLLQDYEMFDNLPLDRVARTFMLGHRQIAVSDYIRREIEAHHGVTGIDVIRNAVDVDQFNAAPRAKNPALTVGFLYSGTPRKNVALTLQILQAAKGRIPHLEALAFGAHAPLDALPLPDWVAFHQAPAQSEIPRLYAACDAWLFTSEKEGFGLPILEAMACRTPVLATPAGAAPELVNDRNGALLAPDVEAFVAALVEYDQMSPADWRTRSDAAYETPASYTWEDATDLLIAAFEAE